MNREVTDHKRENLFFFTLYIGQRINERKKVKLDSIHPILRELNNRSHKNKKRMGFHQNLLK